MALPTILSGSAGRAVRDIKLIQTWASRLDGTATTLVSGREFESQQAWYQLVGTTNAIKGTLTNAEGDLRRILGDEHRQFSSSTRGHLQTLRAQFGLDREKPPTFIASVLVSTPHQGHDIVLGIDALLPKLQHAARVTAAQRIALGGASMAAAATGVITLRAGRHD